MLKENHCNVKSPIVIDKKYGTQDVAENYHQLKGKEVQDYYFVIHMSAKEKKNKEEQKTPVKPPVDDKPKPPVEEKPESPVN